MLKVEGLQTSYGTSKVLFDISLEIHEGEVVTLLGRKRYGQGRLRCAQSWGCCGRIPVAFDSPGTI